MAGMRRSEVSALQPLTRRCRSGHDQALEGQRAGFQPPTRLVHAQAGPSGPRPYLSERGGSRCGGPAGRGGRARDARLRERSPVPRVFPSVPPPLEDHLAMADSTFGFSLLGLASILGQNTLTVPPNQRDYSWTVRQVTTLFQDFARSIAADDAHYFVGTIVTIPRDDGGLEVVDGQQRLATTAIMLAEIRNYLKDKDEMIAQSVDEEILTAIDRSARARVPRLRLNLDDNDYFRARLTNAAPVPSPSKVSHELIDKAFCEAREQVKRIVSGFDEKDHGDTLNRWINFMQQRARAVLLQVPNDAGAYRMFETLNDRGLRSSQSDLVKNYLFGRSGDRMPEVQQRWSLMRGALETIEDDDITVRFLRHSLTLIQGFVREQEVYETVQRLAKAPQRVVSVCQKTVTA